MMLMWLLEAAEHSDHDLIAKLVMALVAFAGLLGLIVRHILKHREGEKDGKSKTDKEDAPKPKPTKYITREEFDTSITTLNASVANIVQMLTENGGHFNALIGKLDSLKDMWEVTRSHQEQLTAITTILETLKEWLGEKQDGRMLIYGDPSAQRSDKEIVTAINKLISKLERLLNELRN